MKSVLLPSHILSVWLMLMWQSCSTHALLGPVHHWLGSSESRLLAAKSMLSAASPKQSRSSLLNPKPPLPKNEAADSSESQVFGAKFFGGSAVKEELFDAQAEQSAATLFSNTDASATAENQNSGYARFQDRQAFPDELGRLFAQALQNFFNTALYDESTASTASTASTEQVTYANNCPWDTPFTSSSTRKPIEEIHNALLFYKRFDIAIIAAKTLTNTPTPTIQVRWAISVVWPNTFQSRVLLTGVSTMNVQKLDNGTWCILSQIDRLDKGGKDGRDIVEATASQLQPRFWDLYHISMTPSAEVMPRVYRNKPTLFSPYSLFELPPALVYQVTLLNSGTRDDRRAQYIPNHAFTSFIKTMGPLEQRYVPTMPVEVAIRRSQSGTNSTTATITWTIQLNPEFISYSSTLPMVVDNDDMESPGTTRYLYRPQRLVATLPHGGNPQDVDVADIRKTLYDAVVKDGWKPCLDESGKPLFFYIQNDVKACFTSEGGLGMAVYDWRPKAAKSNEVGIELTLH